MTSTQLYTHFQHSTGVSTDTRTLRAGQLFFALKGPSFNGNAYAKLALESGATCVVVDEKQYAVKGDARYILVKDALKALQSLANHHRKAMGTTILGLTGSNGKTTTKELMQLVFESSKRIFVTPGNYNNHIGLPLSLLQLQPAHELAILEMGDNQPGDIRELCEIAAPDHALITNIGFDHLGGYTDMDENAAGKLELFDYVNQQGGTILYNTDDDYSRAYVSENAPQNAVGFGWTNKSRKPDFQLNVLANTLAGMHFEVQPPDGERERFEVSLYGQYNLPNLLAAIVAGRQFGASYQQIRAGIGAFYPSNNRSQILQFGRQTIIADAYNANPSSIHPAIENAAEVCEGRLGFVLGDMNELGEHAAAEHKRVGKAVKKLKPEMCVFIGPEMKAAKKAVRTAKYEWFESTAEASPSVQSLMQNCDVILLKGSRSLKLEQLIPALGPAPGAHQTLPA